MANVTWVARSRAKAAWLLRALSCERVRTDPNTTLRRLTGLFNAKANLVERFLEDPEDCELETLVSKIAQLDDQIDGAWQLLGIAPRGQWH